MGSRRVGIIKATASLGVGPSSTVNNERLGDNGRKQKSRDGVPWKQGVIVKRVRCVGISTSNSTREFIEGFIEGSPRHRIFGRKRRLQASRSTPRFLSSMAPCSAGIMRNIRLESFSSRFWKQNATGREGRVMYGDLDSFFGQEKAFFAF